MSIRRRLFHNGQKVSGKGWRFENAETESKNIDYKPVNSKFGSLNVRMVTSRDIQLLFAEIKNPGFNFQKGNTSRIA